MRCASCARRWAGDTVGVSAGRARRTEASGTTSDVGWSAGSSGPEQLLPPQEEQALGVALRVDPVRHPGVLCAHDEAEAAVAPEVGLAAFRLLWCVA